MFDILKYLLKGTSDFYPFEKRILEAVVSRVGENSRLTLQHQIDAINKVQRLANGKEVNLYRIRGGKAVFDDNIRFSNAPDEALLASMTLVSIDKRVKLKVNVWMAKGRLFSLVFNKSPKQFFDGLNLNTVRPDIEDVKIWFDPRCSKTPNIDISFDTSSLTGWLRDWYANGNVTALHHSFSQLERNRYLACIDARLPDDYLELVSQTEGAKIKNCMVYGVAEIRQIVWPEANYYVLADIEGLGCLAVKEGQYNAELYMLRYEDNDKLSKGTSFHIALFDLLNLG